MAIDEKIKEWMANVTTGYGYVFEGILDCKTITDTPNMAAGIFLASRKIYLFPHCDDEVCDCLCLEAKTRFPEAQLVRVNVEVCEHLDVDILHGVTPQTGKSSIKKN